MAANSIKLVLVGDGTVGKTCMLSVYSSGKFPYDYVPTVVENISRDVSVDSHAVQLHLWDTAGQEEYDRLRPLSYPGTDVFLLCFSVDGRSSYRNVRDKWHPELANLCPDTPVVLVATKTDLRTDQDTINQLVRQNTTIVTPQEGQDMAKEIGAKRYVECSAKQHLGLDAVFQEAVRVHFAAKGPEKKKTTKRRCELL